MILAKVLSFKSCFLSLLKKGICFCSNLLIKLYSVENIRAYSLFLIKLFAITNYNKIIKHFPKQILILSVTHLSYYSSLQLSFSFILESLSFWKFDFNDVFYGEWRKEDIRNDQINSLSLWMFCCSIMSSSQS